ncbi:MULTISPECIES: hypothetical protein [unclassified Mycobacteroides]|uniref:hypothetical protein n=1 Tax=unclassified Mycobacteroides TaxID=2618759 RepID=UPI000A48CD92|nr:MULTISPECIES: hypothetical protein [unclassified Mycobacteroides]
MNPRDTYYLECEGSYPIRPRRPSGRPARDMNVMDCIAELDLEDIDALLAPLRARVPDSALWHYDKVILETYLEAREAAGINPRGLTWPGLAFEWDTPEDEEVDAA